MGGITVLILSREKGGRLPPLDSEVFCINRIKTNTAMADKGAQSHLDARPFPPTVCLWTIQFDLCGFKRIQRSDEPHATEKRDTPLILA